MTAHRSPRFPTGFLIGAATAAHQIEGNNINADLWDAEWTRQSIFAEPSGDACDSYHRYPEDIALLAQAGLDSYRFGVEWARVEPEDGWFSRAELDHYRRVLGTCLDHGVTPVVTYQHFTSPKWFARRGGWDTPDSAQRFARFVERATAHLGDLIPWVCTINEANLIAELGDITSVPYLGTSEGRTDLGRDDRAAPLGGFPHRDVNVMANAHRLAVEAVKSGPGNPAVGWTLALIDLQPVDGGEQRCAEIGQKTQLDFLDISRDDDFVGVQTYTRMLIGPDGPVRAPRDNARMQTGWEVYPQALESTVRLAAAHTGRPVLVTEHGIATADDAERIAYTSTALDALQRVIADGVDVRGYLHWSLLDNFEWMAGYGMNFGLIEVD
ncbi:MAG: family 1 glycosylhydrolase, partial [Ilumatobacteraceae bacterium]